MNHERFNTLIFYCRKGLGLLNEFRNLFFIIIGGCIAIKITSIWIMGLLVLTSLPLLILVGWYVVHHTDKVSDKLQVKFGSTYTISQYNLFVEIRDLLIKLNKK